MSGEDLDVSSGYKRNLTTSSSLQRSRFIAITRKKVTLTAGEFRHGGLKLERDALRY